LDFQDARLHGHLDMMMLSFNCFDRLGVCRRRRQRADEFTKRQVSPPALVFMA
jgi:hypothetical protein